MLKLPNDGNHQRELPSNMSLTEVVHEFSLGFETSFDHPSKSHIILKNNSFFQPISSWKWLQSLWQDVTHSRHLGAPTKMLVLTTTPSFGNLVHIIKVITPTATSRTNGVFFSQCGYSVFSHYLFNLKALCHSFNSVCVCVCVAKLGQ